MLETGWTWGELGIKTKEKRNKRKLTCLTRGKERRQARASELTGFSKNESCEQCIN